MPLLKQKRKTDDDKKCNDKNRNIKRPPMQKLHTHTRPEVVKIYIHILFLFLLHFLSSVCIHMIFVIRCVFCSHHICISFLCHSVFFRDRSSFGFHFQFQFVSLVCFFFVFFYDPFGYWHANQLNRTSYICIWFRKPVHQSQRKKDRDSKRKRKEKQKSKPLKLKNFSRLLRTVYKLCISILWNERKIYNRKIGAWNRRNGKKLCASATSFKRKKL